MRMPASSPSALGLVLATFVVLAPWPAWGRAQAPSTLPVEVRVVDRDGAPVTGLLPEHFEVEVAGRRRRVRSASYVARGTTPDSDVTFIVAIDSLTFGQGASKAVTSVARAFLDALPAGSRVGFVTLPQGPAVEVTTDRAAVAAALDQVSGQWQAAQSGTYGLTAADVIEYLGANDKTAIVQRFCGTAEDDACPSLIDQEVAVTVNSLETQARTSLGALGGLATRLAALPGRKVLVVLSGGLPVNDRSGARPDVGNLPVTVVDATARGDIAMYTLLLDRRLLDADAAAVRGRQATSPARESDILGRWAEQFAASSGGAMVRIQGREADPGHGRVVRETTGAYVLDVETIPSDRSGALLRLRVRADARGATVRSRQTVVVK